MGGKIRRTEGIGTGRSPRHSREEHRNEQAARGILEREWREMLPISPQLHTSSKGVAQHSCARRIHYFREEPLCGLLPIEEATHMFLRRCRQVGTKVYIPENMTQTFL